MAVDHDNSLYEFSGTSWGPGTALSAADFTNNVNVSCSSNAFCVATASTSLGEVYFKWNGISWSSASAPFDHNDTFTVSLSCTAATFCLETGDSGYGSVFNGTTWSAPIHIDGFNASPVLYSSCVATSCVGLDRFDNFLQTSDGTTWSAPTNIHATTLISGIESLSCATATLCVAGDGVGDATTYAVAPVTAAPSISGPATVGQTLTLTHAAVATSPVWYSDNWRRCSTQGSDCTTTPISTSTSGYTLVSADAGQYVDVLETIGFGFDEEGSLDSNAIGALSNGSTGGSGSTGTSGGNPAAHVVKLTSSISTTRGGVVDHLPELQRRAVPRHGQTHERRPDRLGKLLIAAANTAKLKITLNKAGKKLLKKHHDSLKAKLTITPSGGKASTFSVKLRAEALTQSKRQRAGAGAGPAGAHAPRPPGTGWR